jgi:hypothetical protein
MTGGCNKQVRKQKERITRKSNKYKSAQDDEITAENEEKETRKHTQELG